MDIGMLLLALLGPEVSPDFIALFVGNIFLSSTRQAGMMSAANAEAQALQKHRPPDGWPGQSIQLTRAVFNSL